MFLSFLGCDGSGKSAVIAGVAEHLRAQGVSVTLGHWRPKPFADAHSSDTPGNADDPHGLKPRGGITSLIKLAWLWLNWWLGWWKFLGKASHNGIVLFDRYHADLLVDPRRYRYGGPMAAARWASRLMPQPDLVFFLDAAPEVLLSRKQEVPREALERARTAYLQLAASRPQQIQIIDASQPLEKVIADAIDELTR
jgi:thymidylate kinase